MAELKDMKKLIILSALCFSWNSFSYGYDAATGKKPSSSAATTSYTYYQWFNGICKKISPKGAEEISLEESMLGGKCPKLLDYQSAAKEYQRQNKAIFNSSRSRQTVLSERTTGNFTKPVVDSILPNLGRLTGGNKSCSASLVGGCVVLTAKHCVDGMAPSPMSFEHNSHPNSSSEKIPIEAVLSQGAPKEVTSWDPNKQGPWGTDWAFVSLSKPILETTPVPVVIRKKGMKGGKCKTSKNPNIILCPEDWQPNLQNYTLYGYPTNIAANAGNVESFQAGRSPVLSTECNHTLDHEIGIGSEGMIRHRCSNWAGNSGGPSTAVVNLNNGRFTTAIVGICSGYARHADASQDGLGWNYDVMPLLNDAQINLLVAKAESCKPAERSSRK